MTVDERISLIAEAAADGRSEVAGMHAVCLVTAARTEAFEEAARIAHEIELREGTDAESSDGAKEFLRHIACEAVAREIATAIRARAQEKV